MRDGTFTISNHGVSGSLFASPIIISQPQSAILGVGKLEKRVVVREVDGIDTIQIRPMAYVSLTIDHRVVDGHQTNLWLSKFVEVIEKWGMT
jgi:2-oxoglutarate dehydrogenase E2 component (dihydrolipoamide succinyltransferase)